MNAAAADFLWMRRRRLLRTALKMNMFLFSEWYLGARGDRDRDTQLMSEVDRFLPGKSPKCLRL